MMIINYKEVRKIKAIYKIENKINHKIYIGQSNNPERRFLEHCSKVEEYTSLLQRAIKKYGKESFELTILGWYEDYNDKEKYYIEIYRSLVPYGYNIQKGGEEPPHYRFEDNNNAKLKNSEAFAIQQELMNWNIRRSQIKKKYRLTEDMLRHIIDGSSWFREDLIYPLRPKEKELDELRAKKVIDLLSTTSLTQKEIGQIVGWNRSAVTMINIGKNHHQSNINYPIRKN